MGQIKLVRIDFRLIHGQVITKWFAQALADRIVIVDDHLAQDDFMKEIYEMAAPPGSQVTVLTVRQAIQRQQDDQLGKGRILVLFKDVHTAWRAFQDGFLFTELQIGGLGSTPKRKVVHGAITLDDADAESLKKMMERGVHVYLQQVPEENPVELAKILEKYDFV
ncbi:MAG: PTS sugar transporter subunit IIB [Bulleidia sp.]